MSGEHPCVASVTAMLDRFDRFNGKGGYPSANERYAMRLVLEQRDALLAGLKGNLRAWAAAKAGDIAAAEWMNAAEEAARIAVAKAEPAPC